MSERVLETASAEETERLGERLGALVREGDAVLLDGELGAGKTCLTRGLARGVGADAGAVSSPTYVIAQEYAGRAFTLVHVDAYRLSDDDDLESVGAEIGGAGTAVVIEWASRLGQEAPAGALSVMIEHTGGDARRLTFTGDDAWAERLTSL